MKKRGPETAMLAALRAAKSVILEYNIKRGADQPSLVINTASSELGLTIHIDIKDKDWLR